MAGKIPWKSYDGSWIYPQWNDVLEEVRLFLTAHYVQISRRQTITNFIISGSILGSCWDVMKMRGTSAHRYWWKQPMDFDLARALAVVATANDEVDAIIP